MNLELENLYIELIHAYDDYITLLSVSTFEEEEDMSWRIYHRDKIDGLTNKIKKLKEN